MQVKLSAIANNSANGKGFVLVFSTANYENIKISYAYKNYYYWI